MIDLKAIIQRILSKLDGITLGFRVYFPKPTKKMVNTEPSLPHIIKEDIVIKEKIFEFIDALHITKALGFNNFCIFTHAFHESGRFAHIIGKYNYWGIKKPSKWQGRIHEITTHEFLRKQHNENLTHAKKRILKLYGNKHIIKVIEQRDYWLVYLEQTFIDFDTIEESLQWYCDFIKRLYINSYNNRTEPLKYFEGLVNGKYKYATDPRYTNKLTEMYLSLLNNPEYNFIKNGLSIE